MRHLVLLAVLASACDQGATAGPAPVAVSPPIVPLVVPPPPVAPPRYVVRDSADFAAKAFAVVNELGDVFADGSKDCERLAARIEAFGAQNTTMFSVLTEYGRAHPEAEKAFQKQFEPQTNALIQKMTPSLQGCMSNQHLMAAFQKLSQTAQLSQQRPR